MRACAIYLTDYSRFPFDSGYDGAVLLQDIAEDSVEESMHAC